MQLTSYPLEFSITEAPTLILDPDPIEEELQYVTTSDSQVCPSEKSQNTRCELEPDLLRSHN